MTQNEIFKALGESFTREEAVRQIEVERTSLRKINNTQNRGRHVDIIALSIVERIKLLQMLTK